MQSKTRTIVPLFYTRNVYTHLYKSEYVQVRSRRTYKVGRIRKQKLEVSTMGGALLLVDECKVSKLPCSIRKDSQL